MRRENNSMRRPEAFMFRMKNKNNLIKQKKVVLLKMKKTIKIFSIKSCNILI